MKQPNHKTTDPFRFSFEAMACTWELSVWDDLSPGTYKELSDEILSKTTRFESTFSRFQKTSFLRSLENRSGLIEAPDDMVNIVSLYKNLYVLSGGKFTPLIAQTLNELGYDENYSLKPKDSITQLGDFNKIVEIVDDHHIRLEKPVSLDFGGLGKGYMVDTIATYLHEKNIARYLVNGSGDIYYKSNNQPISIGLENPCDTSHVIGTIDIPGGACCASASNRRAWRDVHHIVDGVTGISPDEILATWVIADSAVLADGIATCLFFCEPGNFSSLDFEYCLLDKTMKVQYSKGFHATFY